MDKEIFETAILRFLKAITPPPFRRWHILEGKIVKVAAANSSGDAKAQSQFVCTGEEDERQINKAFEEFERPCGNYLWREVRRKREWRWPWQSEIKVTRLGEGGTVLLSDGTFNIKEPIEVKDVDNIIFQGVNREVTVIKQTGEKYPLKISKAQSPLSDLKITGNEKT